MDEFSEVGDRTSEEPAAHMYGGSFAADPPAEVAVRDRSWIKVDSYKEVMEFRRVE